MFLSCLLLFPTAAQESAALKQGPACPESCHPHPMLPHLQEKKAKHGPHVSEIATYWGRLTAFNWALLL